MFFSPYFLCHTLFYRCCIQTSLKAIRLSAILQVIEHNDSVKSNCNLFLKETNVISDCTGFISILTGCCLAKLAFFNSINANLRKGSVILIFSGFFLRMLQPQPDFLQVINISIYWCTEQLFSWFWFSFPLVYEEG